MLTVLLMMVQAETLPLDNAGLHVTSRWPLEAYYPDQAMHAGVNGDVQVRCTIRADTRLRPCELVSVSPVGQGFNDSAKRLLKDVAATPVDKDGQPTAGKSIQFTIEYRSTGQRYGVTFK